MPIRIPAKQLRLPATLIHYNPPGVPAVGRDHVPTADVFRVARSGASLAEAIVAFPDLAPIDIACAIAFEEGRAYQRKPRRARVRLGAPKRPRQRATAGLRRRG